MKTATLGTLLSFLLTGCACGGPNHVGDDDGPGPDPDECSDPDGDGYGAGAGCLGSDCNESVPAIHSEEQCADYCDANSDMAPGCACSNPEPQVCYGGAAETLGVGACRGGLMVCEDGFWGECVGQVLPQDEICDERDDNCNGEVDEGVLSACGNCNDDCQSDCIGVDCPEGFDPENDGAQGVVSTPEGGITLDGTSVIRNHVIWVSNSGEGTVTKMDTRAREETGRYRTGAGFPDPSRTTVNPSGDVVVANRGSGYAIKYLASDCEDADGDGDVETSTGADDVYAFEEDECWQWSTLVGSGARGSAFEVRVGLDGVVDEYVWIGDYAHMDIHEIESESGDLTGRTITGVNPYGVALGQDNKLWTFGGGFGGAGIAWVDTTDDDLELTVIPMPAGESWYGITVDSLGRVWIGGTVARYDPAEDEWESPDASVQGGGIAVDGNDDAYVGEGAGAWYRPGPAYKIDGDTLDAEVIEGGGHGWAIDFDGFAWSVPITSNLLHCTDPDTGDEVFTYDQLVSAYTYSDMTGFQLVHATNPIGMYPHVFEGCEGVTWHEIVVEGVTPLGTSLGVSAKTAATVAGLVAAPRVDLGTMPPSDGVFDVEAAFDDAGITPQTLLYVEVLLTSAVADAAPVLMSLETTWSCLIGID